MFKNNFSNEIFLLNYSGSRMTSIMYKQESWMRDVEWASADRFLSFLLCIRTWPRYLPSFGKVLPGPIGVSSSTSLLTTYMTYEVLRSKCDRLLAAFGHLGPAVAGHISCANGPTRGTPALVADGCQDPLVAWVECARQSPRDLAVFDRVLQTGQTTRH